MSLWTRFSSRLSSEAGGPATAAQALLERVIREERDRSVAVICGVRLGFALLNALVVFPAVELPGYSATWPSRYGAVAYAALAGVLLLLVMRVRRLRGPIALAPAFFDIPFIGAVEYAQATFANEPGIGAPSSVAMLLTFVAVSTLSLSRRVVLAALVPTLAFLVAILWVNQTDLEVSANVLVVTVGLGAVCVILVGKIRRLVQTSRQRDLLGKYVLGERLGAGGMAEVFRAIYSPEGGFERTVAVKRILPSWAGNAELVALFRREAEIGARLAHPNVVQVLDFGADGDTFFLAMEFVDGLPLSRLLKRCAAKQTVLPVPVLIWLAHELGVALEYVHSRTGADGAPLNLVHRDLNPPNILVSTVGEVKLADFGIARSVAQADSTPGVALTQPGMMRGKLAYASPEQALGGTVDGRTDLFALGVTLYEASTAARLFGSRTDTEVLRALLEGAAEDPRTARPELPAVFAELVHHLLARNADERPATGAAVVDALGDAFRVHGAEGREQLVKLVKEAQREPAPPTPQPPPRVDAAAQTLTRTL